jgi:dienelactone hydrolase
MKGTIMGITLWESLSDCAKAMARDALCDVQTIDDWERLRPQRQLEFRRSMGLDPLPERCPLKLTDYGAFAGQGYRARKIAFQILPDCWGSADVYYPDPLPAGRAPGVLYVCGHATIGTHHYQYHPILWARRGYVCLIVDTIEQNDNPGEHHGQEVGKLDSWVSLGYTAAGGELWNAMRALDVLAGDPHVDPERLAVTGVSGGGACSFHLAIVDQRIKAVSTLCGISTPYDAIANRHLISHCNCFYPNNIYRRDTSEFAALIAPRAALFCFADGDTLFHPEEIQAFVERTRKVYTLAGAGDKCRLVTCPGAHGDHPEFDDATCQWFDTHVAGEVRLPLKRGPVEQPERVTTIFNGAPPTPNRLDLLPHLLSPRGVVPLPNGPEDWPAIRRQALEALPPFPGDDGKAFMQQTGVWRVPAQTTLEHRGRIDGVDVWMYTVTPKDCRPALVLGIAGPGGGSRDILGEVHRCIPPGQAASGGFEPRLGGQTCHVPPTGAFSMRKLLPFALPLTGSTPVTMTSHDIGVALNYLFQLDAMKGYEIYLYGKGDAGVAALYRGIQDERVAGVILEDAPRSHLDGAPILGILRAFDLSQAVGLMAPRKVALINPGHNGWTWPARVYERLGCPERFITADTLAQALPRLLNHAV